MPLFSFDAIWWTYFKVSKAISLVFRETCKSENTTQPFVLSALLSSNEGDDDDDDIAVVKISLL